MFEHKKYVRFHVYNMWYLYLFTLYQKKGHLYFSYVTQKRYSLKTG